MICYTLEAFSPLRTNVSCLSVCLYIHLFLCLSVSLSFYMFLCMSLCMFLCLYICLYICISVSLASSSLCFCLLAVRHPRAFKMRISRVVVHFNLKIMQGIPFRQLEATSSGHNSLCNKNKRIHAASEERRTGELLLLLLLLLLQFQLHFCGVNGIDCQLTHIFAIASPPRQPPISQPGATTPC